jgi:hypothetical protein
MDANTPITGSRLRAVPGKCWWTILGRDTPLHPFVDKTWPTREIEPI